MSLIIQNGSGIDEEAEDRDEFHIDKLAQAFTEAEDIGRGDGTMWKGQSFYNGIAFKECVLDYALHTGFNLKQYRYDKDKIGYKCIGAEGKCGYQAYAAMLPNQSMWKITVYKDQHSCSPNGECEMFKVPVIARIFLDKIREYPEYYLPAKIEEIIMERWKISVTRPQCQAARRKALAWIEAEYDLQFARLRDYAAEILEANAGSVVKLFLGHLMNHSKLQIHCS